MIPAQTAQETEQAKAVRGEALRDEELDAVAGGEGYNGGPNTYSPGDGFHKMEYVDCHYCHRAIILGEKHDCPAKRVPFRL